MSRQEIKLYIQPNYMGFTVESRQELYDKFIGDQSPDVMFANGRTCRVTANGLTQHPSSKMLDRVIEHFGMADFKVFNVDYAKGTAEIEWFGEPLIDVSEYHLCTGSLTSSFEDKQVGIQLLGFYLEPKLAPVTEIEQVTPDNIKRDGDKLTITINGASREYKYSPNREDMGVENITRIKKCEIWHFGKDGSIAMINLETELIETFLFVKGSCP